MTLLLLALLGTADVAYADGPATIPDDPSSAVDGVDPARALQRAVESYALGDFDGARAALLEIVQRARVLGDVPFEVEADAWVYLGEMQFLEGNPNAADLSFRMVLERDATFKLSPVIHGLDVIGFFEIVRNSVLTERAADLEARKPYPWWGYAPFGVPQFKQRRKVRGGVYAAFQVGLAAASVGAFFVVDAAAATIDTNPSQELLAETQAELARVRALRDGLSFGTAAAFYVTWAVSVADGGTTWRRDQNLRLGIGLQPRVGGGQLTIGGTF